MYHRVKRFCSSVTVLPYRSSDHKSVRFHNRKPFAGTGLYRSRIRRRSRHYRRNIIWIDEFDHMSEYYFYNKRLSFLQASLYKDMKSVLSFF